MWKSLSPNLETQAFYINIDENTGKGSKINHRVFVTNYVKLWFGEFDSNKLLEIMQNSNTGVEASNKRFLEVCHQMLHHPKQLDNTEFFEDNEHLTVKLILKKGIVFKMNFTLNVHSAEHFFDIVTRPLLSAIYDLRKSETELRHYLEEIRVYLRRIPEDLLMRFEKLKTEEYNDERHMKTHCVMDELLGNTEENFDPKHILNGRPISTLPFNSLPVKEETELTDPGSSKAKLTVKPELVQVTIDKERKYPVKDELNTVPMKTEPTTVVAKPSALKRRRSSDSTGATSKQESSDIKTEPCTSDITTQSNSIPQYDDAIVTNDILFPHVPNQTSPVSNTSLPVDLLRTRNSPNNRRKKLNY